MRGVSGPSRVAPSTRLILEKQARALAGAFGLVGLFGIDFMERDGVPWPIEINPRYTASVEVVELALARPLLHWHRRVCEGGVIPDGGLEPGGLAPPFIGKAVLYADRSCVWPECADWSPDGLAGFELPTLADVPEAGTRFAPGDPVVTAFARGTSLADCHGRLDEALECWGRRLISS